MARRKVPLSFSEALASLQSLDPWNTKTVQRELYCMALVLPSPQRVFLEIRAIPFHSRNQRSFPRSRLNLAALGEILIYLLAAHAACRETKLEGCADSIKTIAHRSNTC